MLKSFDKYVCSKDIKYSLDIVCEVVARTIGINVYKEQKKAVLTMLKHGFIDVKTGQGKSLIAAIAAILLSKTKDKIYIISVNDYLSERDSLTYKCLYDFFKISVSYNKNTNQIKTEDEKRNIYNSNIVYTSGKSLIFDYLRYIIGKADYKVKLDTAIVDEADFVLIDNANSEFSLSDSDTILDFDLNKYIMAKSIFNFLQGAILDSKIDSSIDYSSLCVDYIFNASENRCYLTEDGIKKIERIFKIEDLTKKMGLYNAILNTIEANVLLNKDKDYIVLNNKIILIDKNNGRLLHSSKKEKGIQTALELKENVDVSISTVNVESLTYQVFFNIFDELYGLSGTLIEANEEMQNIYSKSVVRIKSHHKNKRVDLQDMFFKDKESKKKGVIGFIKENENNKYPILIICESDFESKEYYDLIAEVSTKTVQLLNSSNYESSEFDILNKAGDENYITIATYLCSRGTDIKIDDIVNNQGGLYVLSLTHYDNLRIDNQIRGRSGRIGQNGVSRFYCSLEDDIFHSLPLSLKKSILDTKDSDFYSNKYQKMLSKKVLDIQKKNYELDRRKRFDLYLIDSLLTSTKNKVRKSIKDLNSKEDIMNCFNDFCKKAILNNNEHENKLSFFGYTLLKDSFNEKIISNLNEQLDNKIDYLSEDMSVKSLFEISNLVLKDSFYDFKESVKASARSYDFGHENSMFNYNKFVLDYRYLEDEFISYYMYSVFDRFLRLVKCRS